MIFSPEESVISMKLLYSEPVVCFLLLITGLFIPLGMCVLFIYIYINKIIPFIILHFKIFTSALKCLDHVEI